METTATSKGHIVIPSSIRRKFGIREGTRIQIGVNDDETEIILTPITRKYVHSLRGKFKGKGLISAAGREEEGKGTVIQSVQGLVGVR